MPLAPTLRRALAAGLIVALVVPLWRGYLFLLETTAGTGVAGRLGAALLLCLAVIALLAGALRLEGCGWCSLGTAGNWRRNLRAFVSGVLLWAVPAAAGIALCVALGWADITARTGPSAWLVLLAWLLPAVMLSEAVPEELLFRGWLQSRLGRRCAHWLAVLVQAAVFCAFAWAVGALSGVTQWMFLPGFALILGALRALTGTPWTAIGVHAAWMGTAQVLAPGHGHFIVSGLPMLQVIAFALLPSATMGVWFGIRQAGFDWRRREGDAAGMPTVR